MLVACRLAGLSALEAWPRGSAGAIRWGRPRLKRSFRLQEADMRPAGQPTRVDRKVPVWGHPRRLLGQPDQRLPVNWRR